MTHEAVRQASERTGARVRRVALYDDIDQVSEESLVHALTSAIQPQTRVIAATWVHSSTGLEVPIGTLARALRDINGEREGGDRVLLCVDGVHGFGVEDTTLPELGCDFFADRLSQVAVRPARDRCAVGQHGSLGADSPRNPELHR